MMNRGIPWYPYDLGNLHLSKHVKTLVPRYPNFAGWWMFISPYATMGNLTHPHVFGAIYRQLKIWGCQGLPSRKRSTLLGLVSFVARSTTRFRTQPTNCWWVWGMKQWTSGRLNMQKCIVPPKTIEYCCVDVIYPILPIFLVIQGLLYCKIYVYVQQVVQQVLTCHISSLLELPRRKSLLHLATFIPNIVILE